MLFGQFVGVWDMTVRFYDNDGNKVSDEPGERFFAWVLGGRTLQDVLVYANPRDPTEQRSGTTLRHYDPETRVWRVVWLGAVSSILLKLSGRPVGDEILVEGRESEGVVLR